MTLCQNRTVFLLLLRQVSLQRHRVHQRRSLLEIQNETDLQEQKNQNSALSPQRLPNTGGKEKKRKEKKRKEKKRKEKKGNIQGGRREPNRISSWNVHI